jgi:predicted nucleotidyltransferase
LVDFDEGASILDQVALTRELGDLLGVHVDVISVGGLRPSDKRILRDAVDL